MAKNDSQGGDHLTTARKILADPDEGSQSSDLYRWALLVVKRFEAGDQIENAEKWLSSLMIGIDPEYLD